MSASSRRATEAGGRLGQRGQSVVEMALALPVLVLVLVSVFNIAALIGDRLVAGYATRQGARMAAQLGNGQGMAAAQVDPQICQAVLASSTTLSFASITGIDIYRVPPAAADGTWQSSYLQDRYTIDAGRTTCTATSTQTYPAAGRNVTPPNEDSIGVRILWQYTPPTGGYSISLPLDEYTVMRAAPVLQ
jgi:Flp pilus assembly protein TadG